jgi:hypothetical protein
MRLANDRDQEIIRSAIPDSSISTTSFISSIGNGEAIAFGEAIAVPMRMRFTRVGEQLLPKANGVNAKTTEETPDTVDLRSIVTRMRAIAGPDISAFQQQFENSMAGRDVPMAPDGLYDDEEFDDDSMADDVPQVSRFAAPAATPPAMSRTEYEPAPLRQSFTAAQTPTIEPYRPDMLPRTSESDVLRRPESAPAPAYQPETPVPSFGAQSLRRDGGPSLRESILKKPLSSLYKRD